MVTVTLVVNGNCQTREDGRPQPSGSVEYNPGVFDGPAPLFQSAVYFKRRHLVDVFGTDDVPRLLVTISEEEA